MKKHAAWWLAAAVGGTIATVPLMKLWPASKPVTVPAFDWTTAPPDEARDSLFSWEAQKVGISPRLAIAVSHVENWGGDSMAVSNAGKQDGTTVARAIAGDQKAIDALGAVGLGQVLPRKWWHSFESECGCGSLFDRQLNACKSVRILRHYLQQEGKVAPALCRYHGSTYAHAQCDGYVNLVMEQLGR